MTPGSQRRASILPWCVMALGASACLDLDGYTIVPAPPDSGTGGTGGSPGCAQGREGLLFTSFVTGTEKRSALPGRCLPYSPSTRGIDLVAIEPREGTCLGQGRITASAACTFESPASVTHSVDFVFAVAGTYRGGTLELPNPCSTNEPVVLDAAPLGADSLFLAKIRFDGNRFCTEWAHTAKTTSSSGPLAVSDSEVGSDGSVAISGALGGASIEFDSSPGTTASGGAFFASWSSGGLLRNVTALPTAPGAHDVATAVGASGGGWVATGALRVADPACVGCGGDSLVVNSGATCAAPGDAGAFDAAGVDGATEASSIVDASWEAGSLPGDAEAGTPAESGIDGSSDARAAAAGEAGRDGSSDGPEAPKSDTENAFLLRPGETSGCLSLSTFGSDRLGAGDAQVGFDVASVSSGCGAYWTGFAGVSSWPLSRADTAGSASADAGATPDGFVARFDGGAVLGCPDGGPSWSVRLRGGTATSGDRLAAHHCTDGVTATTFVRGARGALELRRCRPGASCDGTTVTAMLGGVEDPLVVMSLDSDGRLAWHGAFGPVDAEASAAAPPWTGRPHTALAIDGQDEDYVLFHAPGTPRTGNVDLARCPELAGADGGTPTAGLWLVHLSAPGSQGRAECVWARRLGR